MGEPIRQLRLPGVCTSGVGWSRHAVPAGGAVQVTEYSHGAMDLLGVQIDAAINGGNSGEQCHAHLQPMIEESQHTFAVAFCHVTRPF